MFSLLQTHTRTYERTHACTHKQTCYGLRQALSFPQYFNTTLSSLYYTARLREVLHVTLSTTPYNQRMMPPFADPSNPFPSLFHIPLHLRRHLFLPAFYSCPLFTLWTLECMWETMLACQVFHPTQEWNVTLSWPSLFCCILCFSNFNLALNHSYFLPSLPLIFTLPVWHYFVLKVQYHSNPCCSFLDPPSSFTAAKWSDDVHCQPLVDLVFWLCALAPFV